MDKIIEPMLKLSQRDRENKQVCIMRGSDKYHNKGWGMGEGMIGAIFDRMVKENLFD